MILKIIYITEFIHGPMKGHNKEEHGENLSE